MVDCMKKVLMGGRFDWIYKRPSETSPIDMMLFHSYRIRVDDYSQPSAMDDCRIGHWPEQGFMV